MEKLILILFIFAFCTAFSVESATVKSEVKKENKVKTVSKRKKEIGNQLGSILFSLSVVGMIGSLYLIFTLQILWGYLSFLAYIFLFATSWGGFYPWQKDFWILVEKKSLFKNVIGLLCLLAISFPSVLISLAYLFAGKWAEAGIYFLIALGASFFSRFLLNLWD